MQASPASSRYIVNHKMAHKLDFIGRGGGIRTRDPLRPRQVRYQAALRPDNYCFFDSKPLSKFPILSALPKSGQNSPDRDKTPSVGPHRVKTRTVLIGLPVQLLQSFVVARIPSEPLASSNLSG